jgi:hypothetical protein
VKKPAMPKRALVLINICAAMSHMCVAAGTRAASDLGSKCAAVHDACATRDQEFEGAVVPAAADVPTLLLHSDDGQVVPIAHSAPLSVKLAKKGTLKVYEKFPQGMCTTHADVINADLLAFLLKGAA